MDMIYHIGAHCTDEERLLRCLLKNRGRLAEAGVSVPPPGRYRQILRDTLIALKGAPASPETQDMILEAVVDQQDVARIIFSHEFFLGLPQKVVGERGIYTTSGRRVAALSNLFPDAPCEFHLSIRNPATLVPALITRTEGADYATIMGTTDPREMRWAPVVSDIVAAVPDAKVIVWCNEDAPMIWSEVLRKLADWPSEQVLEGEEDFLASLLQPDGFRRMQAYLAAHPPRTNNQRRKQIRGFLGRFALPDEMEMEISLPGWTEDLVAEITANYDADLSEIMGMERVELILP